MSVSPARRIAFEVLRRVEEEGAYASDVLHAELGDGVKPSDAALATELTLGVLRWRAQLDFLLDRHLKKAVDRLDLPVAIALRLGLYQLRFLHKIPTHAALNESVELVKSARKASAASLVNAVLRKSVEETPRRVDEILPADMAEAERLAIIYSHPTWLVEAWLARHGKDKAIELLEANNRPPRLTCSVSEPRTLGTMLEEMQGDGLTLHPGRLLKNAFSVSGGSPSRTNAFREGRISIQDEASQAIALLLGVKPGDRVLDLCAAPGGKTAALIRAAGDGFVVASDLHAHRLRSARTQFARLHLDRVHLLALDAEQELPLHGQFDRVLVDAPCSGTGTLARHPEIRWRLDRSQLPEFHGVQSAILRSASPHVKPGGRLLYSTCSLEREENEAVVEEFLLSGANNAGSRFSRVSRDHMIDEIRPHLAAGVDAAELFRDDGYFRTSPARHGTDGFFAATLEKE